jgi:chemotaxis protein CheX
MSSSDDAATSGRIVLPEVMDLRAASPLATQLKALAGADVEIDASQVRRLGGQCLQVLLSAQATWEAKGGTLRFVDPSPEFLEAVTLMGATSLNDAPVETHR